MDIFRWDRYDQVALQGILALVPVAATASLVPAVADAVAGNPIEFVHNLPSSMTPDRVRAPVTGTLVLDDPSLGQHLLHLAPHVLVAALVCLVALQLWGVAASVGRGEPFETVNVRRLVVVALALLVGGPAVSILDAMGRAELARAVLPGVNNFSMTLPILPMLAGLLVAFFAEVFRRGAQLRAELEGLV